VGVLGQLALKQRIACGLMRRIEANVVLSEVDRASALGIRFNVWRCGTGLA